MHYINFRSVNVFLEVWIEVDRIGMRCTNVGVVYLVYLYS
jgi:hypothetical protein